MKTIIKDFINIVLLNLFKLKLYIHINKIIEFKIGINNIFF